MNERHEDPIFLSALQDRDIGNAAVLQFSGDQLGVQQFGSILTLATQS